jgi:hypothetical protein
MATSVPPGTDVSVANIRVTNLRWDAATETQYIELANISPYVVDVESAITVNGAIAGFIMRWEGAQPSEAIQEQFSPRTYTDNGIVAWQVQRVTVVA